MYSAFNKEGHKADGLFRVISKLICNLNIVKNITPEIIMYNLTENVHRREYHALDSEKTVLEKINT